jgi:hypothetical protein
MEIISNSPFQQARYSPRSQSLPVASRSLASPSASQYRRFPRRSSPPAFLSRAKSILVRSTRLLRAYFTTATHLRTRNIDDSRADPALPPSFLAPNRFSCAARGSFVPTSPPRRICAPLRGSCRRCAPEARHRFAPNAQTPPFCTGRPSHCRRHVLATATVFHRGGVPGSWTGSMEGRDGAGHSLLLAMLISVSIYLFLIMAQKRSRAK